MATGLDGPGGLVKYVEAGSIAFELGVQPGDRVIRVNGRRLRDVIDYRFYTAEPFVSLEVETRAGARVIHKIEKHPDEPLGIVFESDLFDGVRRCANRCPFCFVDGLPPGMRASLYLKDDDYRLSFLHGNFITLTNVTERDLERIDEQRLSPLYVSVHSTNPDIRERLLGTPKARAIGEQLRWLAGHDIAIHAQIVVCPGMNDGEELERTVKDLAGLWPRVRSVGVVPVGLTRYSPEGCGIRGCAPEELGEMVRWWKAASAEYKDSLGYTFVFLGDEVFIGAGAEFPTIDAYEDFPQYENGIGVVPTFLWEMEAVGAEILRRVAHSERRGCARTGPAGKMDVTLVSGLLALPYVRRLCDLLERIPGIRAKAIGVRNRFFGESVTVSGLLTGRDVLDSLAAERWDGSVRNLVLIPAHAVRDGVFLDGVSVVELKERLAIDVVDVPPHPKDVLERVLGWSGGPGRRRTKIGRVVRR